ncbi:EpsG family protein [Flavobacterium psychrophilum]|nr:EpsG family protein [Flavobacterium psychrophilum]
MVFYITSYLFTTFLAINYNNEQRLKVSGFWLLLFFILPALLIAVLKGNIGTDTFFYLAFFDDLIKYDVSSFNFEPGFQILAQYITCWAPNKQIAVGFVILLTTVLLCKSFSQSKQLIVFFSLLVFPIFYVDMTMNGLRYGLSFALAVNAIDYLYKGKFKFFIALAFCSISVQYSGLLIILVFLLDRIKRRKLFIISVLGVAFLPVLTHLFDSELKYLVQKEDAYGEIYSPSIASGSAPLFLYFFIHFLYNKYVDKSKISKIIYVFLLFELLSFVMAKFTWAGLRFQYLFLFVFIIYIKQNYYIEKAIVFGNRLVLVSLISFLFMIKNIIPVSDDLSIYQYIPYQFYWEVTN